MPYTHDPDALGVAPEGTYPLTITKVKDTFSKKGDAMFIVEMEDDQGNEVTEFIVQKPKFMDWKFKPIWKAAGLDWPEDQKAVIDEQDLVDRVVLGTVKHSKSADFGLRAELDGVAAVGTEQLDDGKGSFDPQPVPDKGDESDDDIPF